MVYSEVSIIITNNMDIWLLCETMNNAIYAKAAAHDTCFDFISGTAWPIHQPKKLQGLVHNGDKRAHAPINNSYN